MVVKKSTTMLMRALTKATTLCTSPGWCTTLPVRWVVCIVKSLQCYAAGVCCVDAWSMCIDRCVDGPPLTYGMVARKNLCEYSTQR